MPLQPTPCFKIISPDFKFRSLAPLVSLSQSFSDMPWGSEISSSRIYRSPQVPSVIDLNLAGIFLLTWIRTNSYQKLTYDLPSRIKWLRSKSRVTPFSVACRVLWVPVSRELTAFIGMVQPMAVKFPVSPFSIINSWATISTRRQGTYIHPETRINQYV